MPFQPGQSGNPDGRPRGSRNKATADLRGKITELLDDNYHQVIEDLADLDPKERVTAWIKLLEYALPKLQRTESTIDLSKLTDQEVDELLARAVKKLS